ncbi:N-acyl-L-amino acid amidohydrolase [Pseudoalteromonas luteoviolacea B = ATCC 29581]|nr:N-acyl-L-amino acid amidohydrolase [Pseudoalteromonas luteoviolacea B = ATCC 29581]
MKMYHVLFAVLFLSPLVYCAPHEIKISAELENQVIDWRRHFHQYPELSNREFNTSKYILSQLAHLELEVQSGVAHTGIVALLKGAKPGPTVAIRADMDALPVTEQVDLPFASKQTTTFNGQEVGVMHACGHDNHMAVLLGVAHYLKSKQANLAGNVMFIFQPAEEGAPEGEEGGAALMLKEGIFKEKPDAVFGLHVTNRLHAGQIGYRKGPLMASADSFEITLTGRQTHGSRPWDGVDPIVAAAQVVMATQTIASRQIDVTKAPSVISYGAINGGIRSNIIPDEVKMIGTIRSFDQDMRADIKERLSFTAQTVAKAQGAHAHVKINHGYPVTINNPELTEKMLPTIKRAAGEKNVIEIPLVTGAEDFSYYALETPGVFFFLGITPKNTPLDESASNHSPRFYVDESALKIGVETLSALALDYLQSN